MNLNPAIDILKAEFGEKLLGVYVFGSFDTEYFTEKSDIDLAVLLHHSIKKPPLWDISNKISRKLERDIDLVNMRTVGDVLRKEVITTGKLIYCSNQYEVDMFETTAISMYLDFNYIRQEIIKDRFV